MKIKKRNLLTKIGLFITSMIWIIISIQPAMAEDTKHYVTDVTQVTYTGDFTSTVNKFTVDDTYMALCIEHKKTTPSIGTELTISYTDNKDLKKILYYGYGGPMEWDGFKSENHAVVSTALLLSHAYSGNGYNANCAEFKSFIDSAPDIPDYTMSFSPSTVNAYIDGNMQRTPLITLQGDSRISVTLTLPAGVSLVYENGNTATQTVTLYGGTSFYLTAPGSKSDFWDSGTLYINETSYTPVIAATSNEYLQDIIYLMPNSKNTMGNLSVQWYNKGSLEIIKTSSNPEITDNNSNFSLQGAVYGLYSSKSDAVNGVNSISTLITDINGYARLDSLTVGTYYLKELSSPPGYKLSEEITEVTINSLTVTRKSLTDIPITQAFQLTKYGEGIDGDKNPLANAGFMACPTNRLSVDENGNFIWDDDKTIPLCSNGSHEMFTDETGYAKSIPLPYGTYLIRETTVPTNYLPIEDFVITIDSYATDTKDMLYFTDESFKAYIKLIKKDSESDMSILNNSATFKIWSFDSDEYVSFTVTEGDKTYTIDEFSTDSEGTLITPCPLMPGEYLLEETTPPTGYGILSSTSGYKVTISNTEEYENYVDDSGDTTDIGIFSVTITNTPITGQIKIHKTGKTKSHNEITNTYSEEITPLSNITFDIYCAKDIYSADGQGTLLYKEGSLVESITTDEKGYATSSDTLPLGSYTIIEKNTPKGYYKCDNINLTISQDNELVENNDHIISIYELNIVNEAIPIKPKENIATNTEPEDSGIVLGESYVAPTTGDFMPVLLIFAFFLLSFVGILLLLVHKNSK